MTTTLEQVRDDMRELAALPLGKTSPAVFASWADAIDARLSQHSGGGEVVDDGLIGYVHPALLGGNSLAMDVSRMRLSNAQIPVYTHPRHTVATEVAGGVDDLHPTTQEFILRAMAMNYTDRHNWDHLDKEACEKAADEIRSLRLSLAKELAHPRPVVPDVLKEMDQTWIGGRMLHLLEVARKVPGWTGNEVPEGCCSDQEFNDAIEQVDRAIGIAMLAAAPESGGV